MFLQPCRSLCTKITTLHNLLSNTIIRFGAKHNYTCRLHRNLSTVSMDCAGLKALWRMPDAVCFDVDSTVCIDEGIDELAAFLGAGDRVAQLTKEAMSGTMTYKESLTLRLNIIAPTQDQVKAFIAQHPPRLTDGMSDIISLLHERNIPVYLISGGFRCIIEKVADKLNIPHDKIYANKIKFFYNGDYAGFDDKQLTCDSGGKPKVIKMLKDKYGYQRLVHLGDGATDMEACPPADGFIGFGGNVIRPSVEQGSLWFVKSFDELISELKKKT